MIKFGALRKMMEKPKGPAVEVTKNVWRYMRRRNSGQEAESRANRTRDLGNNAFLPAGRGLEPVLKDFMKFEKYAVPAAPRAYACVFSKSANYLRSSGY